MVRRSTLCAPAALLLLLASPAPFLRAQDAAPLSESERIHHALNRFAFGPRPGLVEEVRALGLERWFEQQLAAAAPEPPELLARLAAMETLELSNQEILQRYRRPLPADREKRARVQRLRRLPREELRDAVLLRALFGANQLREVVVDFLRNHFNVDVNKGNVAYYAVDWEREVLRAHALGKFGELLLASAQHPAMLVYLDNALSRRPPSKQELREIERRVRRKTGSRERAAESVEIARQRGLNENYARELLELHTLGVDNGYSQRDVIEVARVLTGWTVQTNPSEPVTFLFRADLHAGGDKRILGMRIRRDNRDPLSEGLTLLAALARSSGTARFLSWKLCRHLVDDDPPDAMVKRIARVFRSSKGELSEVYRAIFHDPEFFAPRHFQSKFKRPFEFVVSALRVTGAQVASSAALHAALKALSEPIYECVDPTGYFDQAEAWNDPGVMAVRWRFAMDLVRGKLAGVAIPASFYQGLHPSLPRVWKDQLAWRILSTRMGARTSAAIDRMIRTHLEQHPHPQVEKLAPLIVGLLLGSPEFQRQ